MPYVLEQDVEALFDRPTICIALLPEGSPWRRRLGCEHDTLQLLLLPPKAEAQPIRPTCTWLCINHVKSSSRWSATSVWKFQSAFCEKSLEMWNYNRRNNEPFFWCQFIWKISWWRWCVELQHVKISLMCWKIHKIMATPPSLFEPIHFFWTPWAS